MFRYREYEGAEFADLLGKTLVKVEVNEDSTEIQFVTNTGDRFIQYHDQDCCEIVSVEDVVGDLSDLLGTPILSAEEVTHTGSDADKSDWPEGVPEPEYVGASYTWTFYKLATIKGSVTIRWYGSSNGYYSESVSMVRAR